MLRTMICFLLVLTTSGCSSRYSTFTRFEDSGIAKPTVAMLPLVNNSSIELPWDISEELTSGIRHSLKKNGKLFLSSSEEAEDLGLILGPMDVSTANLEPLKKFASSEFVIMLELVNHKKIPYDRGTLNPVYPADGKIAHVLALMVRVHVVDIRGEQPQTILHEIVRSNHLIPTTIAHINAGDRIWGENTYNFSPIGLAHARLERDIAGRLEDYILVAKSR
ncbi:MAG: hypothetical protein ACI9S8_001716 [Chlamydiales bacterium]|jgi:hypothetical protein